MQINQQTLQILRAHGPMNASQFAAVAEPGRTTPSVRLTNALAAGLAVRTRPFGEPFFVYAAPEEGPLLAALREVERELTATTTLHQEAVRDEAALEAELQALEMRLAEVRVLKGQHHEAALRLRKGADALHETVYGSVPVAPVATALLDALATRKVVPLRGQALSPGTRFETKHDLGIFDDPSAYPQVQEG